MVAKDGPDYVKEEYGTIIIERWYFNGVLHRENGPAVKYTNKINGNLVTSSQLWYRKGSSITQEVFAWAKDNFIDLDNLTEPDIILMNMKWGR